MLIKLFHIHAFISMIFGYGFIVVQLIQSDHKSIVETFMIGLISFLIVVPFTIHLHLSWISLVRRCILHSKSLKLLQFINKLYHLGFNLDESFVFLNKDQRKEWLINNESMFASSYNSTLTRMKNKLIIRLCLFVSAGALLMVYSLWFILDNHQSPISNVMDRWLILMIIVSSMWIILFFLVHVLVRSIVFVHLNQNEIQSDSVAVL